MRIEIEFPGGARVDALVGEHLIKTDQPPQGGGEGSAPTPFTLFLASLATCAGFYVLGFCRQRGLSTEGLRIVQDSSTNPSTGHVEEIDLEIELPVGFPEQYRESLVRAADLCAVKEHLQDPPKISISAHR